MGIKIHSQILSRNWFLHLYSWTSWRSEVSTSFHFFNWSCQTSSPQFWHSNVMLKFIELKSVSSSSFSSLPFPRSWGLSSAMENLQEFSSFWWLKLAPTTSVDTELICTGTGPLGFLGLINRLFLNVVPPFVNSVYEVVVAPTVEMVVGHL